MATQMVWASFASTDNNSAPRFGVVVRYQDPQNYYSCYRQVGGSSVVRIAKMQMRGTVLKSVGIGNPALNPSPVSQASGTTLTLRIDGVVKLSAIDGTFSTVVPSTAISEEGGLSPGRQLQRDGPVVSAPKSPARASPNRGWRVLV